MQFGEPVIRAFSITGRFTYLWLLALLGGADVAAGEGIASFPVVNLARLQNYRPGDAFLHDRLGLILMGISLLLLVAVAWILLSCVTTGALVRASAEHDAERPFSFALAWRAGSRTLWSILGIRLLYLLLVLLVLLALALVELVLLLLIRFANNNIVVEVVAIGCGILAALSALVILIALGLVLILATRVVVLEQQKAVAGLRRGYRLLRDRWGQILLLWLIQLGLTVGVGAGLVSVIFLLEFYLSFGAAIARLGGPAAADAFVVAPSLAFPAIVGAVIGTYFSTYWTLAFRRLEIPTPPYA